MRNKIASIVLAAVMVLSLGSVSAFAADAALTDGSYTATAAYMNASNPTSKSMSAPIFADTADITVSGDTATMDIYVANPVPYGDGVTSENGSITNVTITIDDVTYTGTVGVQNTSKTFHASTGLFTITEGDVLTCDTVEFALPVSALDAAGTSSFVMAMHVNPVMNTDVSVQINISDITAKAAEATEPTAAETSNQQMNVTADVDNAPSYTVTVPQLIAMGTLSASADNTKAYEITVTAKHMGSAYITVTAPDAGKLASGSNVMAFANALTGNTKISADATINGTLTVTKEAVDAAANGNYTGTLNFTISYFAA